MSAQPQVPIGRPYTIVFQDVSGGLVGANAAKKEILLTKSDTMNTIVELLGPNRIQWGFVTVSSADQAKMSQWDLLFKRGGKEVNRWDKTLTNPSRQGPYFPGFPFEVAGGNVQFALEVTSGASAPAGPISVRVVLAAPPQLVLT